jgi:hypothetical protein
MAYGLVQDETSGPLTKARTVAATFTLPDVGSPESDVSGLATITLQVAYRDGYGSILESDIDALHQALVDFIADYTGMYDASGEVLTIDTVPVTPTP